MIVQCKQCRTKFRFDDAQMDGDGLWMRCSRCQHVFFQENPLKTSMTGVPSPTQPDFFTEPPPEKPAGRLTFEAAGAARGPAVPDEDVKNFLQDVMADEKTAAGEMQLEFASSQKVGMNLTDIEFSPASENFEELDELQEAPEETPAPPPRKKRRWWKIALLVWAILVIIVLPAVVYFVLSPQLGDRYIQIFRKVTGVEQQTKGHSVIGQVKLQDIRQRVINNYILGNVRIVEGTAVNEADYSIARIRIKAELVDAYAVLLDEKVSYAGNVLTDEELTNLSEEDILKKLSLPEGRDNTNERVIPNGQIPFMIVFTRDPQGSIKTKVTISGAERLL
ncbi:MAG: zinc-ribbon domain-containing protein [Deltaproteobacteria bacterium]